MPISQLNGITIIGPGGVVCVDCCDGGSTSNNTCNKVKATVSGLPECADEANGEHILCQSGSIADGNFVACTDNFIIAFSVSEGVTISQRGRLRHPDNGCDFLQGTLAGDACDHTHIIGTVWKADLASATLDPVTGATTYPTAISATTPDGCGADCDYPQTTF